MYKGEILNASEYNAKYCNCKVNKKKLHTKQIEESVIIKFWNQMSEQDKLEWAQSYMSFLEYFEIHYKP